MTATEINVHSDQWPTNRNAWHVEAREDGRWDLYHGADSVIVGLTDEQVRQLRYTVSFAAV